MRGGERINKISILVASKKQSCVTQTLAVHKKMINNIVRIASINDRWSCYVVLL